MSKKVIPGFPNYAVTKDGRVWSYPRRGSSKNGKWLVLVNSPAGYLRVNLCKKGNKYRRLIHHLVLETYIGRRPTGMECRHLDGNRQNNNLDNLCWGTRQENTFDAIKHGTHRCLCKGDDHPNMKLTDQNVKLIIDSYYDGAYSCKELAEYFGVSFAHVWDILNKKRRKHVWEQLYVVT